MDFVVADDIVTWEVVVAALGRNEASAAGAAVAAFAAAAAWGVAEGIVVGEVVEGVLEGVGFAAAADVVPAGKERITK